MEGWQINNITKNLPELLSWTDCNTQLLAKLKAGNVLGEDDIQAINCEKKPNCKAEILYNTLRTRKDAYYILVNALIETKQTGAAELLLEIPTEKIIELQILFMGNQNSVESPLNPDQIKSIQTWLQKNASFEERFQIHKTIFDQDAPLQLLHDTIPEPDPLYVPRRLICRQVVNPKLFLQECPDVFVFKNADRMELRKVVNTYGIEYSSRQLLQREITVRFIILDVEANWLKMCSKVNSPVHLIRYENETGKFILEETSGDSNILSEYLWHNQEVEDTTLSSDKSGNSAIFGSFNSLYSGSGYTDVSDNESEEDFGTSEIKKTMYANKSEDDDDNVGISEDHFVKTIMEQNVKCIAISDLPGMGKSYLLASLARKIKSEYPDRIVAFIQLQNFKLASNFSSTDILENAHSQLFGQLATSKFSQCILLELLKCKSVKLELFFDGLDEVQEKDLEPLLEVFQTLAKPETMPETRIFVTSRPVIQAKLERALRVIAYDIKPFNAATQLRYVVTQWAQAEPACDVDKLEAYAQYCLSSFEKFLEKKKSHIIGIPLQCKLIADVYSTDAGVYANKNCKIPIQLPQNFPGSLFEIYSKFIRRQLGSGNCNFACLYTKRYLEGICTEECKVRNFHVHQAFCCILGLEPNKLQQTLKHYYEDLSTHKVLSPGILRKSKHGASFEFIHRTFAEYLLAVYFWKGVMIKSNKGLTTIQRIFFQNMLIFLMNEGFAYFLDCMIRESQKNENMQLHRRASMSPVDTYYFHLLIKCIISSYKGLLELCFKATENHKLNGKTRKVRSFWLFGNSKCSKPVLKWKNKDGKYEELRFSRKLGEEVAETAAAYGSATTFDRIYNFFMQVLHINLYDYAWPPPIEEAIKRGDFELVAYFSEKMQLENHGLLYKCLQGTYYDTIELVEKKLEIATFLLEKCPDLITESCTQGINEVFYLDDIEQMCRFIQICLDENWRRLGFKEDIKTPIHSKEIHLDLLKFFSSIGCDILVPNRSGYSIVYSAAEYMSDADFFDLCRFICTECKARDYFLDPANWGKYVSNFRHWVEERPTKSLFRILCNLELETVFIQNNPFLSTPKVYEKHMEVFHSLIYSAFKEGKLDFANVILSLDSYPLQLTVHRNVNLVGTSKLPATRGKLSVSKESNIFSVSSEGETILHMAARTEDCNFFNAILCMLGELWHETQDSKALKALISDGAFSVKTAPENLLELFNWPENEHLETPVHYAVKFLEDLPLENIDILFSIGYNYQDKANEFTLVDINAVSKHGDNALAYAIKSNQRLELVRHLVDLGADWTIEDMDGCNITHVCAKRGLVDHLKYFLELGSDVNQPDNEGNHALQCAMKYEFWYWHYKKKRVQKIKDHKLVLSEIIQVLIDAGGDKTHKNKAGKSAYDLALDREYPKEILNML